PVDAEHGGAHAVSRGPLTWRRGHRRTAGQGLRTRRSNPGQRLLQRLRPVRRPAAEMPGPPAARAARHGGQTTGTGRPRVLQALQAPGAGHAAAEEAPAETEVGGDLLAAGGAGRTPIARPGPTAVERSRRRSPGGTIEQV